MHIHEHLSTASIVPSQDGEELIEKETEYRQKHLDSIEIEHAKLQ